MPKTQRRKPAYRRVLLKLSGEVLRNRDQSLCIDPGALALVAGQIKAAVDMGVEMGVVIGGGNIFRGIPGADGGISRNVGDYMGMLATAINGLALQDALEKRGQPARVQTALEMQKIAEPFVLREALEHLQQRRVLIFAAGTGNPYFSTDTAAALRASEIGAEVLLKATKVDGVYSADPLKHPEARRYRRLGYGEALRRSLKIMDAAAFSLCRENRIPIVVFDFFRPGNLERVLAGDNVGTRVGD